MPIRSSISLLTALAILWPSLSRLGLGSCFAFALLGGPQLLHAQPAPSAEYDLKAAFLLNFAQFVRWPNSNTREKQIVFGILGDDPFGTSLDTMLDGRTINELPIQVRRIKRGEPISGVDVLFISSSEAEQLDSILDELQTRPTLTVSDIERFAKRGGMIGFVLRDGRVRFQINQSKAEAAGLTLSAKLLKLAEP